MLAERRCAPPNTARLRAPPYRTDDRPSPFSACSGGGMEAAVPLRGGTTPAVRKPWATATGKSAFHERSSTVASVPSREGAGPSQGASRTSPGCGVRSLTASPRRRGRPFPYGPGMLPPFPPRPGSHTVLHARPTNWQPASHPTAWSRPNCGDRTSPEDDSSWSGVIHRAQSLGSLRVVLGIVVGETPAPSIDPAGVWTDRGTARGSGHAAKPSRFPPTPPRSSPRRTYKTSWAPRQRIPGPSLLRAPPWMLVPPPRFRRLHGRTRAAPPGAENACPSARGAPRRRPQRLIRLSGSTRAAGAGASIMGAR